MHINLRHFFSLAAIADTGRLAIAAEQLHVSQSALTQAVRKLEKTAGTSLFDRSGFGVSPTVAGKALIRRARRAIELLSFAEHKALVGSSTGGSKLSGHVTACQLNALVAIVDTGGYSTAARRLGLAQPSIHRAAKDFEALVGVDLFQRATRGVEPSDAAKILARFASLMFAEIRQGFEEVWETQGRTDSRVAIGSLPLVRSEFLPDAVTQLLSKYPDARVSILDGPYVEQLHALRHGQIDWLIGALRSPPLAFDVVQESLFDQPLAVIVRPNHPLLDRAATSVAELSELEWIAPRALAPARRFFDAFFEDHGKSTPTRIIECSSLVATRGLLLKSDRAALLSPIQISEDVAAGELAVLVNAIPKSSRAIGITTRVDWEPTTVQAELFRILRALANKVSAGH